MLFRSFDHDGSNGNWNSIIRIDSDTYLLAYKSNGGNLKTFTIPADGSTVTQVAYHNYSSTTSYMYQNDLLQIDADTYILAYSGHDATTSYGQHIKTFKVKPDGSSIAQIGHLEHDTNYGSEDYSDLVRVDHDTYALAYYGYDGGGDNVNGGWIKTFTVNGG